MSSHNKHTPNPDYKSGDNWVTCDVCGFDIYASDIKKRWDGLLVCEDDYELRHPQDFVRARKDKISADIVNPSPEDITKDITLSDGGASTDIPDGTFNEDTL